MPTRGQTIADAISIFANTMARFGSNLEKAWLGIYQALMWHEPVTLQDFGLLPHIIDADKLRPRQLSKMKREDTFAAWQRRAIGVSRYLANALRCTVSEVPHHTDLLMKRSDYVGKQRQNTLGIAFAGLVEHVLRQFASSEIETETEVAADHVFPGITFPGRSGTPRMDILVRRNGIPRAIVSTKWSLRHDRLNDLTNECPVYKAAYHRVFRQVSHGTLLYYVVTNEYDPSRLQKVINDTCIDAVVHVHKPLVVDVCGLNNRLTQLLDLAEWIRSALSW